MHTEVLEHGAFNAYLLSNAKRGLDKEKIQEQGRVHTPTLLTRGQAASPRAEQIIIAVPGTNKYP